MLTLKIREGFMSITTSISKTWKKSKNLKKSKCKEGPEQKKINQTENRKAIEEINETKGWFLK